MSNAKLDLDLDMSPSQVAALREHANVDFNYVFTRALQRYTRVLKSAAGEAFCEGAHDSAKLTQAHALRDLALCMEDLEKQLKAAGLLRPLPSDDPPAVPVPADAG